jgi:NADPH-dependent ferric siderophore reductase
MTTASPRPPKPQCVLQVQRSECVSPHLVRVILGGENFDDFVDNGFADKYVKIVFVKPELGLEPPYDLAELRTTLEPDDRPVTRTYTVRWVDAVARELAIDFVVHGDEGLAGPWAAAAQPGDTLVFAGPGGLFNPDATADWHLLAGDDSAIPAISAVLEAMPADAVGHAFIEVDTDRDILPLTAPRGVELHWLLRGGVPAGEATALVDAVAALDWPAGRVSVFAHGEREAMKGLRRVFAAREVPRADLSLSGYWAYGRTEDRFQAEKREPVGVIFDEDAAPTPR